MNPIVQLLVKHGYAVLFASVFARQMWLRVPAILVLIAAGVLAGSGRMTLAVALGLAIIACLLADIVWYEAGRRWGDQMLHFIYGFALDPDGAARRSKETFVRDGLRTLMLAKFVVGLDAAGRASVGTGAPLRCGSLRSPPLRSAPASAPETTPREFLFILILLFLALLINYDYWKCLRDIGTEGVGSRTLFGARVLPSPNLLTAGRNCRAKSRIAATQRCDGIAR